MALQAHQREDPSLRGQGGVAIQMALEFSQMVAQMVQNLPTMQETWV